MTWQFWLGLVLGVVGTLFVCATLFVWWVTGVARR